MKFGAFMILLIAFLGSCSSDKTVVQSQKSKATPSAAVQIEATPTETAINSPNIQVLQPDLHISGTPSAHISGITTTSKHLIGQ